MNVVKDKIFTGRILDMVEKRWRLSGTRLKSILTSEQKGNL